MTTKNLIQRMYSVNESLNPKSQHDKPLKLINEDFDGYRERNEGFSTAETLENKDGTVVICRDPDNKNRYEVYTSWDEDDSCTTVTGIDKAMKVAKEAGATFQLNGIKKFYGKISESEDTKSLIKDLTNKIESTITELGRDGKGIYTDMIDTDYVRLNNIESKNSKVKMAFRKSLPDFDFKSIDGETVELKLIRN